MFGKWPTPLSSFRVKAFCPKQFFSLLRIPLIFKTNIITKILSFLQYWFWLSPSFVGNFHHWKFHMFLISFFCRFLFENFSTSKFWFKILVWEYINASIETFDFLHIHMRKNLTQILKILWEKDKVGILWSQKLRVCLYTISILTQGIYFVGFPQNFSQSKSKLFSSQNRKA